MIKEDYVGPSLEFEGESIVENNVTDYIQKFRIYLRSLRLNHLGNIDYVLQNAGDSVDNNQHYVGERRVTGEKTHWGNQIHKIRNEDVEGSGNSSGLGTSLGGSSLFGPGSKSGTAGGLT